MCASFDPLSVVPFRTISSQADVSRNLHSWVSGSERPITQREDRYQNTVSTLCVVTMVVHPVFSSGLDPDRPDSRPRLKADSIEPDMNLATEYFFSLVRWMGA